MTAHYGHYTRLGFNVDRIIPRLTRPEPLFHVRGGFREQQGHEPVPGEDYDPGAELCQDDYEWLTSTGRYSPDGAGL